MSGLIKKKNKPTMQPPVPVFKTQDTDFGYTAPTIVVQQPVATQEVTKVEPPKPKAKTVVGKSNSTKSIKVPTMIHSEINLLGSFMDESKTYAILQKLIDSYVKNELTDRQQRQFEFMVEAFNEEK
ncbi:MAG TPA: hypothetical protein VNR38_06080 [Ureibacillus sp.]|nr:hypothetical protein [Ureibacillus sp.]